jgi:pilin isopeptide linkage protein
MNINTVETHNRKSIAKNKNWLLFIQKVIAVVLAFLMVFASSETTLQAFANDSSINLEEYLTDKTTMQITVWVDGVKYVYTPDELVEKGIEVPKGAPVSVKLYFKTISGVSKGQTLVYQLPKNLMDYSGANENGYVWQDVVWEENNAGADVEAADWTIDSTGKLTVTIRDDFFEDNKHTTDNTVDLFGFNIKFSGSLSSERGEHSGNDDNVYTFRGSTDGTGKIQFTVPFEYKNEHANVLVDKKVVNFDVKTSTATYKVTVTAPNTNSYTATNVVVKDEIRCDLDYIETYTKNKVKYLYRDAEASTGEDTFDAEDGVWTIGEMQPGQEETLTYSLVINDDAYKSGKIDYIDNIAVVDFNDDGSNYSVASLELPSTVMDKTVLSDKNGIVLTTEDGETYATYTITVTANNGSKSDVKVMDSFDNSTLIEKIVVPEDGASVGTTTVDNTTASLVWTIDKLKDGETATLTYRAYLNADAWQTTQDPYNPGTVVQSLKNTANLYVGDDKADSLSDYDSVSTSLRKTWVKKNGQLVTDKNDEKYNKIKYTVVVNSDPVTDNIETIYDILSSGGTYEDGGYIELVRYTSSDKSNKVDTTKIPLSEVVTTYGSGYSWVIDLVERNLNGPYYYELTYYVESSSVMVDNNAGIGFGTGPGYVNGSTVQGAGGMTYGSDYSKSPGTDNYKEAYTPWTVTVKKTVQKGSVFVDRLSAEYVYNHEQFWFDDDCLDDIEIKFDGKTLVAGVDYTVKGVVNDDTRAQWSKITDPDGKRYNQFEITFNNEYQATSSNALVINYKQRLNMTPKDQNYSYSDGCTMLSYNYCRWRLPGDYGKLVETAEGANYSRSYYNWNKPLEKTSSTYDDSTGTITWTITVNPKTSVSGDAVLEEYLPEGLTYDSITVKKPYDKLTKDTIVGDVVEGTYINDDGKECVKLTIPITNLYEYLVTSSRFETGVGEYTGWSGAGELIFTLVTKVDEAWRMNLTKNTTVENKATLTGSNYSVNATAKSTIPATQEVSKSMAGRDIPAYVEYALNVNPNGSSLINNQTEVQNGKTVAIEDDTLQIVDTMSSGMSLSMDHVNNFKVYDVTNVSDLLDSNGNVIVSQAQSGIEITGDCSFVDVTGNAEYAESEDDVGKPTYVFNVPDGKHVVIIYWATFEGAEDESVTISNSANFYYKGKVQTGSGDKTENSVVASDASSSLFVGPFFYLRKTDQWGKMVEGVQYNLYQVELDSEGNELSRTLVMTKTTTADDTLYFGHRSSDSSTVPQLYKNKLYCLVEVDAPAGYAIDSTPYYFEFKEKGYDAVESPNNTVLHQFVSGGTYSFVNQFTAGSISVPVKKTINNKNISSDVDFSFTLKPDSSNTLPVYVDDTYTTQISSSGIKATITGSGDTLFAPLFFKQEGTYKFTLSEDDLSTDAQNNGYSKDDNVFNITIQVAKGDNNELAITKATYTSTSSSGDLLTTMPTFNNICSLTGSITLNATKVVENRAKAVQQGEFKFKVSVDGKPITEQNASGNTVTKYFYTENGGNIVMNLDINQDDIGTHTYVISEVEGDDPSITYSTERVKVKVTIAEAGNGTVAATKYEYLNDPVFTNEYSASGSVKFEGKKILNGNRPSKIKEGEFTFTVKENDKTVATGKTASGGDIDFDAIKYTLNDVGTHTYVISEDEGTDETISYSTTSLTVTVIVSDNGDGTLKTEVVYPDGGVVFTNDYLFSVPTGIELNILPYAIIVLAVGCVVVAIIHKNKRKTIG